MNNKIYSRTTNKCYDVRKCVRIVNMQQAAAYMCNGAELLDIYASRHYETGNPILVCLFDRESTTGLYDKWCNRELK